MHPLEALFSALMIIALIMAFFGLAGFLVSLWHWLAGTQENDL